MTLSNLRITSALVSLRGYAGWSAKLEFATPQVTLSRGNTCLCFCLLMNLWSGYLMVLTSRAVFFEKGTQPEYSTKQEDQVALNCSPEIC